MPSGTARDAEVQDYRIRLSGVLSTLFNHNRQIPPPSFGLDSRSFEDVGTGPVDRLHPGAHRGGALSPARDHRMQCTSQKHYERERAQATEDGAHGPARAVGTTSQNLWTPGQVIKYFFQQPEYAQSALSDARRWRRSILERSFQEWATFSHLQFSQTDVESESDIRIFFYESEDSQYEKYFRPTPPDDPSRENSSSETKIGPNIDKVSWGMPNCTMYLEIPSWGGDSCAMLMCLHEMGHALGLGHEEISPVTQTVLEPTIHLQRRLFRMQSWTPYDPNSIMLNPGIELQGSSPTREFKTKLNFKLSATDKWFIGVSSNL